MPRFMIDAGHDEFTAGKGVPTMKEFEFNKVVTKYVSEELGKYQDVVVFFSHDLNDKIDQSLNYRTEQANKLMVDAFISIHANAGVSTARGIETFVYPTANNETKMLAKLIHDHLIKHTKQKDRGVKKADFHVLRETKMMAVLVECGFMTNDADLKLLKSDGYRRLCAVAIVSGLVQYYGLKKKEIAEPKQTVNKNTFYRVVAGSYNSRTLAEMQAEALKKAGFTSFIDVYEK